MVQIAFTFFPAIASSLFRVMAKWRPFLNAAGILMDFG